MSRSLRARGLKLFVPYANNRFQKVALFTGAWIETVAPPAAVVRYDVALFTGAWIETLSIIFLISAIGVALFTGAWIETDINPTTGMPIICRALYGRVD